MKCFVLLAMLGFASKEKFMKNAENAIVVKIEEDEIVQVKTLINLFFGDYF